MVTVLSGVALLVATLAVFSLFSLKMPKGSLAMSGMADAAVATFLVEAIHKYISGDLIGIAFLREVGDISGSMALPQLLLFQLQWVLTRYSQL